MIIAVSFSTVIAYSAGILYAPMLTLQLTASVAVLGVLSVLAWIGYAMLTEPLPPLVVDPTELDDLQSETISPELEDYATPGHPQYSVIVDAEIGEDTIVKDHVNLYKCKIGRNCKIDSFVYIEEGVKIGDNCKIRPHVFIPTGVVVEDDVFVGPNVTFTNDKYPRIRSEWQLLGSIVRRGASIGANSVILPGVTIGRNATVGAGSVVTKDVPDRATVCGNPTRLLNRR
jgi:acetyltransferase-like isoleucine patch superfamily enzyme